jgi:hypothetical protein
MSDQLNAGKVKSVTDDLPSLGGPEHNPAKGSSVMLGSDRLYLHIIESLLSPDPKIRISAKSFLANHLSIRISSREEEGNQELIAGLSEIAYTRARAEDTSAQLLDSRTLAIEALAILGGEAQTDELMDLIDDGRSPIRIAAYKGLGHVIDQSWLDPGSKLDREHYSALIVGMNRRFDTTEDERLLVIGKLRTAGGFNYIQERIEDLDYKSWHDGDPLIRAMGEFRTQDAIFKIQRVLKYRPSATLTAMETLAKMQIPESIAALEDYLFSFNRHEVEERRIHEQENIILPVQKIHSVITRALLAHAISTGDLTRFQQKVGSRLESIGTKYFSFLDFHYRRDIYEEMTEMIASQRLPEFDQFLINEAYRANNAPFQIYALRALAINTDRPNVYLVGEPWESLVEYILSDRDLIRMHTSLIPRFHHPEITIDFITNMLPGISSIGKTKFVESLIKCGRPDRDEILRALRGRSGLGVNAQRLVESYFTNPQEI